MTPLNDNEAPKAMTRDELREHIDGIAEQLAYYPYQQFSDKHTNNAITQDVDDIMARAIVGTTYDYLLDDDRTLVDTYVAEVLPHQQQEVQTLLELRQLYDQYEAGSTKDFEGNDIATWSGYKLFRNPITDRLEEITGHRSDKDIRDWLAALNNKEGV